MRGRVQVSWDTVLAGRGGLTCCWPLFSPPGNSAFKSPDAFKVSLPLRTNYLYGKMKKTLPELYAFTICLWLRSSASPGIGTPFSYAVPGQANEIVLIEWGNNPIELLINDKVRPAWMPPSLSQWQQRLGSPRALTAGCGLSSSWWGPLCTDSVLLWTAE